MNSSLRRALCPAVGVLLCIVTAAGALESASCLHTSIYVRKDSLQQTLLSTRARYVQWVQEQPAARKAVSCDPWLATQLLPVDEADRLVRPTEGVDLAAASTEGQPVWTPRPELVDGKSVKFLSGADSAAVYLTRAVHAERPARLTIGIGGGDRLDAWLNGRKIAQADTHLTSGRYGCSYRVDGTRVDQVLLDLDLQQGENVLVVRLVPGSESSFYFSPSPQPVPRLWEQIRADFPAPQNPLLELVHADWFAANGWFTAEDSGREQVFLERVIVECDADAAAIRTDLERLRQQDARPQDPAWLDLCVHASVCARLRTDLGRLRAAVQELGTTYATAYPLGEMDSRLDEYEQRLTAQAARRLDPVDDATRQLMAELPQLQREMLVDRNPLLKGAEILLVKRYTYDSKHYYDDFLHLSRFGGNLCVLSLSDGAVREIAPQLDGGIFDRYGLSFDGRRIAFGYRRPELEGFRIYEIGVDGSGLRQITYPPEDEDQRVATYGRTSQPDSWYGAKAYRFWTDDLHPCYLPDGAICFASTRCEHGVLCTPAHYLACTNLFRVDADGSNLQRLSQGALSEYTPTMMEDGRILYNRWEYVYKGIAAVQPLWVMRPDGSGSEEFYGDNITNPGVLWQARQVPGHPRLAVGTGCGHEPLGVGQILLLDLNKNKRTLEPITSLTPEIKTQGLRGLYQLRNGVWREDIYGPFYADPYPLSDKFFLVSCNPEDRYNDQSAYGIYLLDAFGNRVPIYDDPEISCWQPMPIRSRPVPPVLPSIGDRSVETVAADGHDAKATVFLSDIYRGLQGVPRGSVKYLRVMEQIPKPWAAEIDPVRGEDRTADGFGGHIAVSKNAHIWIAVLRGIVPVEEDGSAYFEVPADRNIFFQALDENLMEIQRMRTFVTFEPGERRSCIGCHEHRTQAPVSRLAAAFGRLPATLAAQPGEAAPRPLHYPTDVQPIWDEHCVSCHNGQDPQVPVDLRGQLTRLFNRSYESIFDEDLVDTIREWAGATYSMENAEAVPPYSHGSHCSQLVDVLRGGHYDVQLSREQWIRLVTWIDCGAPYYGSYYGRRNLAYQGQPDFRPVPTVQSACGIPPEFPELQKPEPLPAELLAWWPLDEVSNGTVSDASGNGCDGRLVSARWPADDAGGRAPVLDGSSYLAASGWDQLPAVSVSLWVKPTRLPNRWNPLLFSDSRECGAFHFSLLEDGTPNLAVHGGTAQWMHRRASTAVAMDRWHHVVVSCDPRFGGRVRFYLDGRLDADLPLNLGVMLDLSSFRLGGWKSWQDNPQAGWQGALDDVRIYRGTLSEQQVTDLYRAGRVDAHVAEHSQ